MWKRAGDAEMRKHQVALEEWKAEGKMEPAVRLVERWQSRNDLHSSFIASLSCLATTSPNHDRSSAPRSSPFSMASVQDAVKRCLKDQAHELAGSLLYLDAGAAEAVAAGVGLAALQELGAAAVCDLAAASAADLATAALLSGSGAPVRRVAFFVTTLLAEAEVAVLAACSLHAAAAQFTVLCSSSQAAHHDELPARYGGSCFAALGAAWQQQLNEGRRAAGQGPCSLALAYCPMLLCPLSGTAFVLAAASAAATLPRAGRLAAGYSTSAAAAAADDSDEEGPRPAEAPGRRSGSAGAAAGGSPASGLHLLAHTLTGVAAVLGYRPEAFALGPCSRQICSHMSFVPTMAEDAPAAALVLVDRVLDPVSPVQHADLLVQRLYSRLQQPGAAGGDAGQPPAAAPAAAAGSRPRQEPFSPLARELPMPSLDQPPAAAAAPDAGSSGASSGGGADGARGAGSLLPGSLRHPDDVLAERWLEFLLSRKGRDGPLFVRKWLREAARKENVGQLQRFKPGSISAAELRSLADGLRRQSPAAAHRHAALLQLAEAAAAALEGPHASKSPSLCNHFHPPLLYTTVYNCPAATSTTALLLASLRCCAPAIACCRRALGGDAAGGAGPAVCLHRVGRRGGFPPGGPVRPGRQARQPAAPDRCGTAGTGSVLPAPRLSTLVCRRRWRQGGSLPAAAGGAAAGGTCRGGDGLRQVRCPGRCRCQGWSGASGASSGGSSGSSRRPALAAGAAVRPGGTGSRQAGGSGRGSGRRGRRRWQRRRRRGAAGASVGGAGRGGSAAGPHAGAGCLPPVPAQARQAPGGAGPGRGPAPHAAAAPDRGARAAGPAGARPARWGHLAVGPAALRPGPLRAAGGAQAIRLLHSHPVRGGRHQRRRAARRHASRGRAGGAGQQPGRRWRRSSRSTAASAHPCGSHSPAGARGGVRAPVC
ncbi:expressed protein [Chlorella variabilis]|uniref:Expressed protein n=1 Tax=Chlorella variabilis TaxID=554065 RepID=E1ZME6_CHLVA|nr:expressed protein [Chlorella variabilis]EFN52991.1 expressed protein [Chlorella variabilis]|eukprot:XP_005845093.1 expressed protein [Chlorella variabilis]